MTTCQFCDEPATVTLTEIVNKKKRVLRLCERCAKRHNLLPELPAPQVDVKALLGLLAAVAPSPQAPLDPAAFALIKALCSAACQRISALAKELTTQLAVEGQRRSPLWNAVRRLQRAADAVSVLCVGTPSRYAAARTALESQLTAMRAA